MRATLVSDVVDPMPFALVDAGGRSVFEALTQPWSTRPEPTSGLSVHVLDFSGAAVAGHGCRLETADANSHRFAIADSVYDGLAADALGVLTLLRSSVAVTEPPAYARPAGHVGDAVVRAWTGPDAERLYPGWRCPGTFDVSGGWYDAGDYGKYVTSGAIAVWQLLAAFERHGDEAIRAECTWQLDWLLRMQVPPNAPLAGMAFHRVHGTVWSPMPGWPHQDQTERVLHRPSTTATLHLAAAAAGGARALLASDARYAERLIAAARTAYDAALAHPDLLAPDDHAAFGGGPYVDDDANDDLCWAASELWLTTGDVAYRTTLIPTDAAGFDPSGFDFDRVTMPALIDRARSGEPTSVHEVIAAADRLVSIQQRQPWGQPYAPDDGWDWGSNGRLLNNLVVLITAADLNGDVRFADAVHEGIGYLFGRNALGQSYVTGYGIDDSHHQRVRMFAHDLDPAFPPPPPGALSGGANSRPHPDFEYDRRLVGLPPQQCYLDEPTSEVTNDICIRWNAPLVYVATYLASGVTPSGQRTRSPA
jgi:endoglucanase